MELYRGGSLAESRDVGEVVVECQADDRAVLQPHEGAVVLQRPVKLRGDAESDGFAAGGVGRVAAQGCGEDASVAELGVELLEDGGFVSGILVKLGVDVFPEGFGLCEGSLAAAVFKVGEVAYEALFASRNAEAPAAECAEFLVAACDVF